MALHWLVSMAAYQSPCWLSGSYSTYSRRPAIHFKVLLVHPPPLETHLPYNPLFSTTHILSLLCLVPLLLASCSLVSFASSFYLLLFSSLSQRALAISSLLSFLSVLDSFRYLRMFLLLFKIKTFALTTPQCLYRSPFIPWYSCV